MNEVFKINPDADFHALLCGMFTHVVEIENLFSACARNARSIREIVNALEHLHHKRLALEKGQT